MDELKILTHDFNSVHRATNTPEYVELSTKIKAKLSEVRSANGNDCEYWLQRTRWDVIHEEEPIEDKNILKVIELAQMFGIVLMPDQARSVYERLLTGVRDAGKADWDTELDKKYFKNAEFVTWFKRAAYDAAHPGKGGEGKAQRFDTCSEIESSAGGRTAQACSTRYCSCNPSRACRTRNGGWPTGRAN
jgi:hypothetical protein